VKSGGLGRGLDALIYSSEEKNAADAEKTSGVLELDINKIEPNRKQPRKNFDAEALQEMADSIKEVGVIQPLIVKNEGDYYSIIAGERRWRAARIAQLATVPVVVKDYSPHEVFQIALIENLQREDLNPIEEASGYRRLAEEFYLNQEDIADRVGKKRSRVAAYLSLLKLDERVQAMIAEGTLSPTHGRHLALLKIPEMQFETAAVCVKQRLTAAELERAVEEFKFIEDIPKEVALEMARGFKDQILKEREEKVKSVKEKDQNEELYFNDIVKAIESNLGTKALVKHKKSGVGKIELYYDSPEEFERIFEILTDANRLS
jgi:ParB family chromosome partitioning protein